VSLDLPSIPSGSDVDRRWDDRSCEAAASRWLMQATWAFVAVGVLLRIVRYAMNDALWGDESFVAANLIGRGYRDLLRPLDYSQVCPLLFLWVEHSILTLLGFSERSLRLFPIVCGVASVPLFQYTAGRLVRGVPLLLAVGIFALSAQPIRLAAEVKPYASDLLVALALMALALDWARERERTGRLWALLGLAPVCVALSFPAIMVAGGVSLGLIVPVWRTKRWRVWLPFFLFNVAAVGTFVGLFVCYIGVQPKGMMLGLQEYWASAFPPLDDLGKLVRWLISVHTGSMFAYPSGGKGGASTPTFLLFVIAVGVLWKRRQTVALTVCLAPFAFALVAAALRRYPYGGEARLMQYVAPSISLLAGVGAATLLQVIPWTQARLLAVRGSVLLGAVAALYILAHDVSRPYRFIYDHRAREFAKRFWPEQARAAEVVCFRGDFKLPCYGRFQLLEAAYLCNQWIYSPQRRSGGPRLDAVSASRPLRWMLYSPTPDDQRAVSARLASMSSRYDLRRCEQIDIELFKSATNAGTVALLIYEFVPKPSASLPAAPPSVEAKVTALPRASVPR
jgi:hypothetical protein